ncbi:MAG: hypothetical protein ABI867_02630 [Kofleriaceae bacterium]
MRGPLFAIIVATVLLGATLAPVVLDPVRDDDFPLSTYPMFATARPTTLRISYALGVTRTNGRRSISPTLVGSGEVLQAYMILERAVTRRSELAALCTRIADRVRDADPDIVTIRIVTGTHDTIAYLVDAKLGPEVERIRCEVRR